MNNKKLIYIFLLLLPVVDLITALSSRLFPTPLSLGVIVKTIFLMMMVLYVIFKSTSKYKKISIIYMLMIIIYIFIYILTKIKYLYINQLIEECMYIFKMFYLPLLFTSFICYFDDKKFDKNKLIKVFIINFITYIIFLLLPLLTNTGFSTYGYGLPGTIGWFYSPNEVAIILILLFPFIYKKLKNNVLYFIIILISIFTIATIGTKVSMFGLILDTLLLLILTITKKNKKIIITSLILFLSTILIFTQSATLNNYINNINMQTNEGKVKEEITKEENKKEETKQKNENTNNTKNNKVEQTTHKISQEQKLLEDEYEKLKKEEYNNQKDNKSFISKLYYKYGKALLSDRDIYLKVTHKIYEKNYSLKTLLFGLGYSNTSEIKNFAITKLIEIDPLDILFHSGLIALIIVLLPFIYYLYQLIRKAKISINLIFYTLMIGMIFCVSCISGHTLMAPAVSIYIVLYFILAFAELGLINKKEENLEKGKVTIYALHLNYGGVEKNICNKANILSKLYNVEIISLYKLTDNPVFELNKNVKVKYLTENIKPNREEFKKSLKGKNIIKILKEGLYAIKVLYLKNTLITKSMINCNSEIIISTRIDFTKKLINNNEYNNIKIAEEHIYHNNNIKYIKNLSKILSKVDYLMPSSNYLTNYYKNIFIKDSYKIITNKMPIETDNTLSNLKNKTIISVGRLDKVKGYSDLINIFSRLNNKDWTLNIVGDGPEYNNLNNLIKEKGLEDNIKLLGFKNLEELNKLYKESSIYIMTSYEESFGLVLLEAASHGLPIIAYSSALGAKEILKDNNGILINNRNESKMISNLTNLMNDIKLRKEYQKKSLNVSEFYKYENIEKDIHDFYKSIINTNIYNNLYTKSKKECYKLVEEKLKNKEKTFIITANPETYMLSEKDIEINNMIYNKENLIVPDGIAVVKTANYLGYKVKERITGVELAEHLLDLANKNKYKVYLFGATNEVMEKLESVINKKYPNIKLVGSTNGYVKDKDSVMEYIKTTKPDIVMLALGIPLQEKLINKHIKDFKKGIFIGVGGSFDVLSGSKKRAPKIFIKLNLEWLYRIMCEPKRITRFIKHNIRFLTKIIKEKKQNR